MVTQLTEFDNLGACPTPDALGACNRTIVVRGNGSDIVKTPASSVDVCSGGFGRVYGYIHCAARRLSRHLVFLSR